MGGIKPMKNKPQVIFANSQQTSASLCLNYLLEHDLLVTQTHSIQDLKIELSKHPADLLLFDIDQRDGDGLTFLQTLGYQNKMGIIVFTQRADPIDKYISLETCADDYIQKPCHYREVLARIRAVHRRIQHNKDLDSVNTYCDNFVINRLSRKITLNSGEEINLTQYEFDVLNTLVSHKNHSLSRHQIIDITFDEFNKDKITSRNIDSIIYRLRQKLSGHHSIKTLYGVGYVFQEIASASSYPRSNDNGLPITRNIQKLATQVSKWH